MNDPARRRFLQALAATGLGAAASPLLADCKCLGGGRVVIIGGGFAGVTCARYLRALNPQLEVLLVEKNREYVTCPFSNLAMTGIEPMDRLVYDYQSLAGDDGIRVIHDCAVGIETDTRVIKLAGGAWLTYDRAVFAPGISLIWNAPEGYTESVTEQLPHAWQAGRQTALLRDQLYAMDDGGVVAISVPPQPYRCPPGPYERAGLIAHYLRQHKPRSKVLILDGNEYFSKQDVFEEAWQALYPGMIERISVSGYGGVTRVDAKTRTLFTETDRHRADVANVIPSQQAGRIAIELGLADESGWCPVDPLTFTSRHMPYVHVLGDATIAHPIPKSASAANSQAKLCALAIVSLLAGEDPPAPSLHNTCYSLAAPDYGFSISGVYRVKDGAIRAMPDAGGISPLAASRQLRASEAEHARDWYASIMRDSFG